MNHLFSQQSADQPGTFTETPAPANSKPMMSVATSPQPTETNPIMSVPPLSHYSPPNSMQGMVPPQQMGSPASMGSSPPAMANPMMQHPQNNMAAPMQQQSNMAAPMGMPTSPNNNMAAMSPPAMMHMNNQVSVGFKEWWGCFTIPCNILSLESRSHWISEPEDWMMNPSPGDNRIFRAN